MPTNQSQNIRKLKKNNDIKGLVEVVHKDKSKRLRRSALRALGKIGMDAVESLGELMYKSVEPEKSEIRNTLQKIVNVESLDKNKDTKGLIQALKSNCPELTMSAAKALGEMHETEAIEILCEKLHDHLLSMYDYKHVIKVCLAEALGEIGDPRAIECLLKAFRGNNHWNADIAILQAIMKIGSKEAVIPLIEEFKNETGYTTPAMKSEIATVLGELGDKRAVPILVSEYNYWSGYDTKVAKAIAIALQKLDDPRAAEVLVNYNKQK